MAVERCNVWTQREQECAAVWAVRCMFAGGGEVDEASARRCVRPTRIARSVTVCASHVLGMRRAAWGSDRRAHSSSRRGR
eukprot:6190443-Pleurochrysis_carterae.AAC.2